MGINESGELRRQPHTQCLTVASRLVEDPETSVLVIEAGPNAQNDTLINNPAQSLTVRPVYNWQYNTTVQIVGGNVIDMTQYMKKAEHFHLPNSHQISLGATVDPMAHGFEGKVNAGFPQPYEATDLAQSMVTAVRAAIPGLVENVEVTTGTPNGVARFLNLATKLKYLQMAMYEAAVDLPAIGTNLQDQAQNSMTFNVAPGIPASSYTTVNAPVSLTVAFLNIEQVLGTDAARMATDELLESIPSRARDIVSSGAFTNVEGMEKILHSQFKSITKFKGSFYSHIVIVIDTNFTLP
ncbi:hypothetical protein C0995_011018 [Termitomyces sp. Mi166|nr:hypothetical protein C0995_011018 [Termitomyces sp. Mi166\